MNINIQISECLRNRLNSIGDKVSNFILEISNGISDDLLNNNYPDFLEFDGNLVTYINSNTVKKNNIQNPWTTNTRQSSKMVKVLRRIIKTDYFNKKLNDVDVEVFVANWNASLDNSCTISEYKGWDILKAFNFNGDISPKFSFSCANFKQPEGNGYDEPKIKWFYFYIYNPNVSVAVLKENGVIKGRSVIFTGEQQIDSCDFKKGETYTYMNGLYSEGDTKYQSILKNWGKERGYFHRNTRLSDGKDFKGSLVIPIKTKYKTYPPVDNVLIDTEKDLLLSSSFIKPGIRYDGRTQSAYKLVQNGGNHQR